MKFQNSKIKNIYLQVHNYNFFHSPYTDEKIKRNKKNSFLFVGRKYVQSKLKAILQESKSRSGNYLITGYRGMGKTSVVRKVIDDLNIKSSENKVKRFIPSLLKILNCFAVISGVLLISSIRNEKPWHHSLWNKLDITNFNFYSESFTLSNILSSIIPIIIYGVIAAAIYASLVYFIISIYNFYPSLLMDKKDEYYKKFDIGLPQENISDLDILRLISSNLAKYWNHYYLSDLLIYFKIYKVGEKIWSTVTICTIIYITYWCFFNNNYYHLKTCIVIFLVCLAFIFFKYSGITARPKKFNKFQSISKRLNFLNSRLRNELIETKGYQLNPTINQLGGILRFTLGNTENRKETRAAIPDSKEIEQELISILYEIDQIRGTNVNSKSCFFPNFIFVIDELDKIEPKYGTNLKENEEDDPYLQINAQSLPSFKIRHRQEVLSNLLANLKSFLNTARAKFIFIGGREMYDAFLADIADRDTFYSSIFHEVIYVRSHLKDHPSTLNGITPVLENILVYYLLPEKYKFEENTNCSNEENSTELDESSFTLKRYYNYLLVKFNHPDATNETAKENKIIIAKIILTLQQFILFLTYRSNGTPKKYMEILERLIVPRDEFPKLDNKIVVKEGNSAGVGDNLYLRISYNRQFDIGMISNIFRPFLLTNSEYIKRLGDKLLISTPFIFDHLLKFHEFGFSWRNIELLPEIIMVNKEPNLRSYIERLLEYFNGRIIRETISGLHQWKFQEDFAREINVLSKISSYSAAAFNFTLDESLLIKRHYMLKLQLLKKDRKNIDEDYIHSIGFLQTVLGDLHYNDKEFDDAIIYYTESIQALRKNLSKLIVNHQFIILLRNELKLALSLERIEAYNSAYSVVLSLIIDIPNLLFNIIDSYPESIGVNERKHVLRISPSFHGIKPYRSIHLLNMPYIYYLTLIEKQRLKGITRENLNKNFLEYIDILTRDSYSNSEKIKVDKELEQKINQAVLDRDRILLLLSDYFLNIGSILYYKNTEFEKIDLNFNQLQLSKLKNCLANEEEILDQLSFDYEVINYYLLSLNCLINGKSFIESFSNTNTLKIIRAELGNTQYNKLVADILSKVCDVQISKISLAKCGTKFHIYDIITPNTYWDLKNDNHLLNLLYYTAMCYEDLGCYYDSLFELKKLLYILKELDSKIQPIKNKLFKATGTREVSKNNLEAFNIIMNKCIELSYKCFGGSPHSELKKYKEIFDIRNNGELLKYLSLNLSNSNDLREIFILREWILKNQKTTIIELNYINNINSYSTFSNTNIRVQELVFKAALYYDELSSDKNLKIESNIDKRTSKTSKLIIALNNPKSDSKILREVNRIFDEEMAKNKNDRYIIMKLVDAIYCLYESLSLIQIGANAFYSNNLITASIYDKLIFWTSLYMYFKRKDNTDNLNLDTLLREELDTKDLNSINPMYHAEKALNHYKKAKETHNQGRSYKDSIKNVYFLEDNYAGKQSHFFIALERMNLDNIDNRISRINEIIANADLFDLDFYHSYH